MGERALSAAATLAPLWAVNGGRLEITGREFRGRTESSGTGGRPLPVKAAGIIMDRRCSIRTLCAAPLTSE